MAIKTSRPPTFPPTDDDEQAFEGLPKSSTQHEELVRAFEEEDARRQARIDNHPIVKFLEIHQEHQTPDDRPVASINQAVVTLGDLKQLLELIR